MGFDRNAIAFGLIAGRHRLEAVRSLGWSEILATVVAFDDVDRMLAEIDENLIRNDLSDLERSEHLAERKRGHVQEPLLGSMENVEVRADSRPDVSRTSA
jgi:ParB-like chromosome segregation protein Spo0J